MASTPALHTPGPYTVIHSGASRCHYLMGKDRTAVIGVIDNPIDAERIAYCLSIVEESEKTDRVA